VKWTRERILDAIHARHARGRSLASGVVHREGAGLYQASQRLFGSWREALEAAGAPGPQGRGRPCKWSREGILEKIRKEAREHPGSWRMNLLRRTGAIYAAGVREFGTWGAALEAAGIDPSRGTKWTRESAARAIRRRWRETGSSARSIARGERGLLFACQRIFGGWRGAAEAAGIPRPPRGGKRRYWTRERIFGEMRREAGERPGRWRSHIQVRRRSIYKAARQLFGSWGEAICQSGLAGRR